MAAADDAKSGSEWKKRESFGSAMAQIAVVAVILAGAVYFLYSRGSTKKAVTEKVKEARVAALRNNPVDLKKGLSLADEALALDGSAADALAFEAATQTELWLVHHEPGADAKAKDLLARAVKADSKGEDRYGTEAMHLLATNPKAADDFIEDLKKRGASSSARLALAQGLATKAQGNLKLSRQYFSSAMEKAWKDPGFAAALGEAYLDEGAFNPANDGFNKGLAQNPDHLRSRLDQAMLRALKREKTKEAADAVTEIMGRDGELTPFLRGRALAVKAELANAEGRYDDAISVAGLSAQANADEPFAAFVKARALGFKNDAAAADAFKAVVKASPTVPLFYFEGASILQKAGKLDDALGVLDAYEAQFKNVRYQSSEGKDESYLDRDDRYWLGRGEVLAAANKGDDAIAAFDKAIAAKSVNQIRAHYAKAAVLLGRKDYDKAAEILVDITPTDGTGQLAEAYRAMGDVQFAKKEYPAGCQQFAYALTRMKAQQAPRDQMNALLTDVEKRLKDAGQKNIAKAWMDEAKPLIQ
ncbi:MAG: cellulose synthase [Myxococcaceae bacterium]|nr:cellulose synthase [Myxococcaceae bacterium]